MLIPLDSADHLFVRRRSTTPTDINAEKEKVNHCNIRNVFPGTMTSEDSSLPRISKCIPVEAMAIVLTTTNPIAQAMRRTVSDNVLSHRRRLMKTVTFSRSSRSVKTTSRRRKARVPQRNRRPVAAKIGQSTREVRDRPDSKRLSVTGPVLPS